MPVLKVFYIAGFNLDKNSGRNKATREKAAALSELLPPGSFRLLYPGGSSSRLIAYLKVLIFDLKMFFTLLFIPKKTRVIQRMTFMPVTNILLRLKGVIIYYELHTDLQDEIKHYHAGWLEKMVLHLYVYIERLNLRLAHAIIYNHPVLQNVMQAKYGKKLSMYTYNGANVKDFVPMDMNACRDMLGLKPDKNYYLFLGSMAKWRGVDLLINIFNSHMGKKDVLLVVGDNSHEYARELKKMAKGNDNIIFYGEAPSRDVVKWINAAGICLVPVKPVLTSPGNPLKMYDYVACGKPLVGQHNVTGVSDEILRYEIGIVTDFYDAERAARDLTAFYEEHNAKHYSAHNREVAVDKISWQKRMQEWIRFLV